MNNKFAYLLAFICCIPSTFGWLSASDGYNIGVTVGSALAGLILLIIIFFVGYHCCLKQLLRDYNRDHKTYIEKRASSGVGSGGVGSRYKKQPQNPSAKTYNIRDEEYVPPSKISNESLQHSGGYYSGDGYTGPQPDVEYPAAGGGSPVGYDPTASDQYGHRPRPSDRYLAGDRNGADRGGRGSGLGDHGYIPKDMDSSTESRTSVRVAGEPISRPVITYDDHDREPSGRRSHLDDQETTGYRRVDRETGGRSSGGYVPYGGSASPSNRGILSRSPVTGRVVDTSPVAYSTTTTGPSGAGRYLATETTYVSPVITQTDQSRSPRGGTVTYQSTRTYKQRTVQQAGTPSAAYTGSSV